jgi:probable phosphoglycerate mutase
MEREIYIVRHGQTDFNRQGIVQGRGVDSSLNDFGRAQAQAFFEAYSHIPFSHVFMSTLKRTKESAAPFLETGLPHSFHPELDEIDWGNQEGQKASKEMRAYYLEMMDGWRRGALDGRMPQGESPLEVQGRQKDFIGGALADYRQSNPEKGPLLMFSHGRAIRILMCTLLGESLSKMDEFGHNNLGLYRIRQEEERFVLLDRNRIDHLEGLSERFRKQ